MDVINIFFLTSCPEDKSYQFSIFFNKKKVIQNILKKIENAYIILNEIRLPNTNKEEIEIEYDLIYKKQKSNYIINLKKEKNKNIYFLFDMKSKTEKKKNIQKDSSFFILKNENIINNNLSKYEKFSLFYNHLLKTKKKFNEADPKQFYIGLIHSFLKEIDSNDLVPIDIIISILIIYSQNLNEFLEIIQGIKINLEDNTYIPIKTYEEMYYDGIICCLNNLLKLTDKNKNIILEIIIIYLIQFKNNDIDIILQKNYIPMIISLFQQDKLIYLKDGIINEEITQKIIQHVPQIENIIGIIKKLNDNYISYLSFIDNNFDNIYKAIENMKSLKGIFRVDLEVSQKDNINEFSKLHQEILKKQKNKGKYFISFISIIKKYYELYKKYKNLTSLSELLEIINLEIKLFPIIGKIYDLKKEILIIIKDLLKEKIEKKDIQGDKLIHVLIKLETDFYNNEIFNTEYKKIIIKYFIEKAKDNDYNTIKSYKDNKIYEFFMNSDKEQNLFFIILKDEEFDLKHNFIELLPEKLNDEPLNIITDLVIKIIKKLKPNEIEKYQVDNTSSLFYYIYNNIDLFLILLEKIEINEENYLKILNLIIGTINNNKIKNEQLYIKIYEYLDNNFFDKNIFIIEVDRKNLIIPLYILQELKKDNEFEEFFENKLSNYVIDMNAILGGRKNNKYLLMVKLYEKNYINYNYKEKILSVLSTIIENRENYIYNIFKRIYENIKEFINILPEKEKNDLIDFHNNKMIIYENELKNLDNILILLKRLYPSKESINIQNITNLIYKLEQSKITDLELFKDEINNFNTEYKEKMDKYFIYLDSYLFLELIYSEENKNEKNEDKTIEKTKKKVDNFVQIIFNPNEDELDISQVLELKDFKKLEEIETELKLREELGNLYRIYYRIYKINEDNKQNKIEQNEKNNRINFIVNRIYILKEFKNKSKIIRGMYFLLISLKCKKTQYFKELVNIYLYSNKNEKEEFLKKIDIFFEKNNQKNIVNKNTYLFLYLSEFTGAIKFLLSLTENEMESLYQFIIDSDYNEHIYLFSLNQLKKYFQELNDKYDYEIIEIISSNLIENLYNYMKEYPYLEELNQKKKGEMKNYSEILEELENSIFCIDYDFEKQKFELKRVIPVKSNKQQILKDYNQLIIENGFFAISHSLNDKNMFDKLKNIIEINNYIKEYISLLNNKKNILGTNNLMFRKNSFVFPYRIKLKIKDQTIFHIEKKQNLKNLIQLMKENEKKEMDILIQYYSDNKDSLKRYLTLFNKIQLDKLYKLIKAREYNMIQYSFSHLFNNKIDFSSNTKLIYLLNNDQSFEVKLKTILNYLSNIIDCKKFWNEIFIKNEIKEEFKKIYESQTIYIKSIDDEDYEEDILNIYYTLTGNLPLFSNIFIFCEETEEQEYLPFLYKVVKTNGLFTMVLKKCKSENIDILLKKINEILLNNKNDFVFLLLYSKQNINKISHYIKNYKPFDYKEGVNCKSKIKNLLNNKIGIIFSDISGLGKTTYIYNLARKNNMKYIYFPIKGNYAKNELLNQLKDTIEIKPNLNNIIHIDIYDSQDENEIKEFLFYFIFFKFYEKGNDIFNYGHLDNNIKIIIELPNIYKNYFDKYKILNYIPIEKEIKIRKEYKIPNLNEKIFINQLGLSKIQIVSNIINLFNNNEIQNKNFGMNSQNLLSEEKCEEIINSTLNSIVKNSTINFYQKINFIKLLSSEFIKFTMCSNLSFSGGMGNLRKNIINSIIVNSKYIIELNNFETMLYEVNANIRKESERETNFEKKMYEIQKEKNKINYNKIQPSLIGLQNDGNFVSIISSNDNCELLRDINKHIKEINKQFNLNLDYIKKPIEYNNNELRRELLKIIVDENFLDNGKLKYENIEDILNNIFNDYVFTLDNFIKMVLLFLRIRAGIPTVIIGETGCGKTYLIKMLSYIYGQNISLYILKFHAGITDNNVINFIRKTIEKVENDEDDLINQLYEYINKNKYIDNFRKNEEMYYDKLWFFQKWFFKPEYKNKYNNYKDEIYNKIKNRKIIIFFDEINTSNSLGTIKRIICDENFRQKYVIPKRFIIICACNPYRFLSEQNKNLQFGLSMRYQKNRKLVYTVNPLPYSLLNFALYFNDISEETAKKYIEKMNEKLMKIKNNDKIILINKLVTESHFFMIKKGDISSVSLREINRIPKIFNFFFEQYFITFRNQILKQEDLVNKSIILSLYFCYYLRLPTTKLRTEYIKEVIIKTFPQFLDICKKESFFITEQILEGKKGYAKNRGLCENIFSEFICILLREPLIICGKPGSSKSLSVRLLLNAMKGKMSHIKFFQQFHEVVPSFYQCSLTSTSENLEKVFNNAIKKLNQRENEIISLIFIDEMGIADESKNNPLKVLHSKLDENNEIENLRQKVAFIGISNWTLDASKMNRAINIVVEEPDLDYLLITTKEIVSSIDKKIEIKFEKIIKAISETYLDYLNIQKQKNKEDFHGFRDYYYLIKYVFYHISKNYKNNDNINNYLNYIFKGIYNNFSGFIDVTKRKSEEIFKNLFLEKYTNEKFGFQYNILERIKDNLENYIERRYLLLITNNDKNKTNEILLSYILKGKEYVMFSEEDINQYDIKSNAISNLLLKIEVLMKKEIILILKNLEILYPSLYELFNKNFSEYGSENKFVKISYEEKQSLVQVNEKFRIIILVNENNLNFEEKPFLNRFEKQLFFIDNIFDKKDLNLIYFCLSIIENFNKIYGINMNYIREDLLYLIMIQNNEKKIENKINNNFWEKLVSLFPHEMIYYLNNVIENFKYKENINLVFKNHYIKNYNFKSFLSNINSYINTIYTYSRINIPLFNNDETIIYNRFLEMEFSPKKIKILFLENIINFKIIDNLIDKNKYNLYLIKIYENQIISSIDNIFEKIKKFVSYMENQIKNKKIIVIYIIYKIRKYKNEEVITIKSKGNMINNIYKLFILYNQVFIENLNKEFINEHKFDILLKNLFVKREDIINDENFMEKEIIDDAFQKIKLQIKNEVGYNLENTNKIRNGLIKNKDIFKLIKDKIASILKIKKIEIFQISKNEKNDFIYDLFAFNKNEISEILKNIINYLEDELILTTILFSNLNRNDAEKNILYNNFKDLLNKFKPTNNYNGIKYIYFGFNLIGLFKDYKKLSMLISDKCNNSNINIKEEIILNDNFKIKQNLEGNENEKKFVFNDYILYFVSLIIKIEAPKEKRDKILIFLNLILKILLLKYNDATSYLNKIDFIDTIIDRNQELINNLENMCIFLEKYKGYLSNLLNILNDFLSIIPNFNDKFISICKNNIKYNDNAQEKLFKIFNIFLDCITDESSFSFYFKNNIKNEYLKLLQKNQNKYETILNLIEKKYSLSLLKIDIFLNVVKKNNNDNFLKMTLNFFRNNIEINEEFLEEKKIILNDKIFLRFIIKQNKINNNNDIFNIFYSYEKFFKYSQYFFGNILSEYINKNSFKNNSPNKFLNIPNEIEKQLNQILSYNNNNFNETLIFYFETIFQNYYFSKIEEEEKDKRLKIKKILEETSLKTVIEYIEFYENNKKNMNIQLIYRIAFVKIYFRYFANILYEYKNGNEYIDFDKLVNNQLYLSANELSSVKRDINIYISRILNIIINDGNIGLNNFIEKHKLTYLEDYAKEIGKKGSLFLFKEKIIPDIIILKKKYNSNNTFKEKYPLLNYCLNKEKEINYLKQIPIINYICNLMLNIFSHKKYSKEIEETKLIDELDNIKEYYLNFEQKILEYIKSYNYLLNEDNLLDNIIPENDYKNLSIKIFLVDENNKNNKLNYIYNKFIEYQNNFIINLTKYFPNKNMNEIEVINVQEASEENIPKLISSDDEFLEIIINNSLIIENNNEEIEFEFDLEEIENELVDKIIPGIKRFNKDKIRIMEYTGEEYNEIDEKIINDFKKKYKFQNINQRQKDYIKEFIENNKEKKNLILLSFQYLMFFILSYPIFKGESNIIEVINELPKNNNEIKKIELIKSFLGYNSINQNENENLSMNESSELDLMNNSKENEDFSVNNLYSIFHEIKNN